MTITTELVLIRHGEANCNVAGIAGGPSGCTGLSPRGHEQAAQVAARLTAEHATHPFDVLYATSRRRVQETAIPVSRALGLAAQVDDQLLHPDHGQADGQPWHQIKTAFAGPPQHQPDQPYAAGAEPWNHYLTRSTAALQHILDRHAGQRILIVGHGETIDTAHQLFFQTAADQRRRVGLVTDHTAITRWQRHTNRFHRQVWMLATHNDTRHLSGLPEVMSVTRPS